MAKFIFLICFAILFGCFSAAKPPAGPVKAKTPDPIGSINLDQIQMAMDLCKNNKGIKRILTTGEKTKITCANGARFQEEKKR